MSKNLNTNLDVLLIFVSELVRFLWRRGVHFGIYVKPPQAALFSAVNSTFIGVTMPSLSPDPLERTNALLELIVLRADTAPPTNTSLSPPFSPHPVSIAVNCLLYSSLCFSLSAAVGAMQAKEWIQSYDRTGQAGSPEHQARVRQRKFNGAQQWHLETIVLILPYLLLLSVLLFFVGVSLFLLPVNGTLAEVVIVTSGLGVSLSSLTIILGSISPICPYQTAASRGLRRGGKFIAQFWKQLLSYLGELRLKSVQVIQSTVLAFRRQSAEAFPLQIPPSISSLGIPRLILRARAYIVKQFKAAFGDWTDLLPRYSNATQMNPSTRGKNPFHDEYVLNADAAGWFLEMTADTQDQLILAKNICVLHSIGRDRLVTNADTWRRLSSLMLEAIHNWRAHPTAEKRTIVEQFGAALGHLLLQYPDGDDTWGQIQDMFPSDLFTSQDDQSHLTHLHYVVTKTLSNHRASRDVDHSLKQVFLQAMIKRGSLVQWNALNCLTRSSADDRVLGMSAYIIRSQYPGLDPSLPLSPSEDICDLWDVSGSHSHRE